MKSDQSKTKAELLRELQSIRKRVDAQYITGRKRADEAVQQLSKDQATLLKVSNSLTASLDMKTVLQNIINISTDLVGLDTGAIYIINGDELYLGAASPPIPANFPEVFRQTTIVEHPHIQKAISAGKSHILPDMDIEDLSPAEQAIKESRNMRTLIYVPIMIKKKALGVLILGTVKETRSFSRREIDLYSALSNQSALAIENARLFEEAQHNVTELKQRILERKEAEEALRDSEEKYRTYIENAPEGIFIVDSSGKYVDVNLTACQMTGYSREELLDMSIQELASPESPPNNLDSFNEVKMTGKAYSEVLLRRKNGTDLQASLLAVTLSEDRFMAFCTDITKRKQAEEELKKQSTQRQRLLEMGRQLTSSLEIDKVLQHVSEEVRTLLGCSGVTIYMLDEKGKMLNPVLAYDPPYEKFVISTKVDVESSLTGLVIKAKQGKIFNHADQQSDGYHIPGTPIDDDHLIIVPFIIDGKAIGLSRVKNLWTYLG